MAQLEKNPKPTQGFFKKLQEVIITFLAGAVTGGSTVGYLIFNADQLNLSFLSRGNNTANSQNTTNNGVQAGDNTSGNIGTNTGTQAGANNAGNVGGTNNANAGGSLGVGNITAGANAKIDIKITPQDPNFQNDKLPGFFPDQGFAAQPPQLNTFEGASVLTRDLLLNGEAIFSSQKEDVAIQGRSYTTVFYVRGTNEPQRATFKLDPAQRGVLLQFGMADLQKGDTNLTYQVNIAADGNRVWSGRVVYGNNQQILSVPLNIPNATAVTVEYTTSIARAGDSQYRNLIFTRAEQLFK